MRIHGLSLVLAMVCIAPWAQAAEAPRPNILFFYVDDMGWGAIGPNGQTERKARNLPHVRTPNLDRLAAQGVNFTRGYGCTVCSPARSSLQTGFHQGHTFADRNDPNNAKKAIRTDDVSIGTALASVGYTTGYWGKWGYGGSKDQANPVIENVQTLPTSHGYRFVLAELHHVRAHTFFQPTLWSAPAAPDTVGGLELIPNSLARYQNREAWPETPALQNHARYPETAYCDDAYAFAALDFVRTQGQSYNQSGEPFFGLLAVQIPHAPFGEITSLPEWDGVYADDPHYMSLADQTRQWAAMVTRIDAHFGNILAALEDPNNDGDTSDSVADNTLVIFQSDNGGPSGKNNVELDANGGLSGSKGKIQEGGIRVPLIMRWPAKITDVSELRAGSNCDMVVDVSDLLPTFCELAGARIPVGIDGVSVAPTLLGEGHQRQREFIIHEAGNGQSIIHGKYKLVRAKKSKLALFDLKADPTELNDISSEHPKLVRELSKLLLDERVTEPKGFANTYHHWIGKSGAKTSNPENWSDYKYANRGITYLEDNGSPRLSWIARISNKGRKAEVVRADADLEVLGLEISGDPSTDAQQSLILDSGINLTGRNEIRLASHATLRLNMGVVSSLRWIDIHRGAALEGQGSVKGTVYNGGVLSVDGPGHVNIDGDYHQSADASLEFTVSKSRKPMLHITGKAALGGVLVVHTSDGFKPARGESFLVIDSTTIEGRFANRNNEIVCPDGTRLKIEYAKSSVTLTMK